VFHARIQVCYRNKNFFYQSLNIDKAVSPYQVWNKVKITGEKRNYAKDVTSKEEKRYSLKI